MSKDKNLRAIILAILAAALYAISTPVSKVMLQTVAPTMVAAFLYLGAGIGMGAMMLVRSGRHRTTEERLRRSDIPYAVAMILLDIAAPILMMYGLRTCSASNTSLLNNCPNEEVYRQMNYPILMDTSAQQLGVFGPTEILCSFDTYQFSNYDRYDAATFSEAHKAEVRNTQFPIDLEKAYELGKRLVGKCVANMTKEE